MSNTHNKIEDAYNLPKSLHLDMEVISCSAAASAKGIPLENELKTLVLETSKGIHVVNLKGNTKLSLRSVKNYLKVGQAHLLSTENLKKLNLLPGIINPFASTLIDKPQLISENVLKLPYVSTNDGTLTGYRIFSPRILLTLPHIRIGNFDNNPSSQKEYNEN